MIGFFGLMYAGSIPSRSKLNDNLFFALALFLLGALQAICLSGDLFNIYVWLELSSICAFAIMGYKTKEGAFATFNYLLAAGVAGVIFLLGTGLIYGASGTLNLAQISTFSNPGQSMSAGFALIITSLLIKMALTPFHFWLPDAYGNSPTKTLGIIPAIVTKRPKRGATPTHNLMKGRFALILELVFEINIPLIALEFHEDLSGLGSHLSTAPFNSLL